MDSSGEGWGTFFKQELGREYNFYLKIFLGGFSFETLPFFLKTTAPPPPPPPGRNCRSVPKILDIAYIILICRASSSPSQSKFGVEHI